MGQWRQLDSVAEHLQQPRAVADARAAPFERALAEPRIARAKPDASREAKPARERAAALEQRLAKAGAADA